MRVMAACVVSLAVACHDGRNDDEPSTTVRLRVAPIPEEVTSVMMDSEVLPIEIEEGVRVVVYEKTYESYPTALDARTVKLLFRAGDIVFNRGEFVPGACAAYCTYPWCPLPQEITLESLEVSPLSDFGPMQSTCLECVSDATTSKSCG